jgi:outer membrane protein TolC
LNWSLPAASWPESGGGGGNGWSAAISLGLSYGPGKLDAESSILSAIDLKRQALKVEDLKNQLTLKYRTGYQAYLGALESVAKAERSLERLSRLKEAVELRQETGQALMLDVRSAVLAHEWGKWKLDSALVQLQKASLSLSVMTGDMGFLLD